jgi:hypothetical protein
MWVRFLKSKNDTCPQLESILREIRHTHARHHSSSDAFAHVMKFNSYPVFEATATRFMCGRLSVGVQYSATYAHYMLGKAERPWRTLRDSAFAILHGMSFPISMQSCAISTVVYLRNVQPRGGCLVAFPSRSSRRKRPTPPSSVSSDALSSPRFQKSSVATLGRKRFAASWLATHFTPKGIASTTLLHA